MLPPMPLGGWGALDVLFRGRMLLILDRMAQQNLLSVYVSLKCESGGANDF
jgi:hypothetical protein